MSLKTIKVDEKSKADLEKICKDYDLNIGEAVEAMIAYFKKTKQNPTDQSNFVEEFKKLKNQLISFIKTQEQEKLNPILQGLGMTLERLDNTGTDKLINFFKQGGSFWDRLEERLSGVSTPHKETLSKIASALSKQKETQEKMLEVFQNTQTKEATTRAQKLFKQLQEDLASKKNALGVYTGVDDILKTYSKLFENL